MSEGVLLLDPCATEDSVDCWWDATVHGNGQGHSFVNFDGTWQVIEFPAGFHLTSVIVTELPDTGGYTPAEQYTFEWTTAPNPATPPPATTTTSSPPASSLAETGGGYPSAGLAIVAVLAVAVGIVLIRRWSTRRQQGNAPV